MSHSCIARRGTLALLAAFSPAAPAVAASWFHEPPRIVQTLWREPDVQAVDIPAILAHLRAVHANAIVLNGGGVVDFFRHDHPMANPSAYLPRDRDVLGELIAACHREGIRVIARVDFRGVEAARFRLRPDWFAVDAKGAPLMRESGLHQTCFNGGYRNEYGLHLIRQLLDRYGVDGIWYNAVQSYGACYCAGCERKYRAGTGGPIPRSADAVDDYLGPAMATYRTLKARWALEHLRRVRETIKSFGEDRVLSVEIFGIFAARPGQLGGVDVASVGPVVDFLLGKVFVDADEDPAFAGTTIRYLKVLDPAKPAVLLTSTNRNRFRTVAENPVEVETALWEAIAAGAGIWNALVAGPNPDGFLDHRNARTGGPAAAFLAQHGARLAGQRPFAEVKILFSDTTREHSADGFRAAVLGAERVLAEAHVPYGFLPAAQLGPAALAGVKALMLPNATVMSEAEIAVIREYVRGGGTIIADFQTSLHDTGGKTRDDFGLADVLGVSYGGRVFSAPRDSPHKIRQRHPVLAGLDATEILLNGGRTARCVARGATVLATRVPPPRGAVPEEGWHRTLESDEATITNHRFGRGQAIYFAHEIMRQSFEDGHMDFAGLLARAVDFARGDGAVLRGNAPPSVRSSLLTDGAGRYTLSFVNHTSTPYRPIRTLVPVSKVEVRLRLPEQHLHSWTILSADTPMEISSEADGSIRVRIPLLPAFASVSLQMKTAATSR